MSTVVIDHKVGCQLPAQSLCRSQASHLFTLNSVLVLLPEALLVAGILPHCRPGQGMGDSLLQPTA